MIFRYAFTHSPSFNNDYFILWNGGPGDVASMWLTILIIEAIVFFALAWLCADAVGSARSARDLHCADPVTYALAMGAAALAALVSGRL